MSTTTPAAARSRHPPPLPLTADDVIRLAASSTSTPLPSSIPHSTLLAPLNSSSPSTTTDAAAYISALLSLISRTPPSPSLPSLLSALLLSSLRLSPIPRTLHLFAPHLPSLLEPTLLPSILELLLSRLSHLPDPDSALDLLPRLLPSADASTARSTIDNLLAADWSKPLLLKIVSLLRDLPPPSLVRIPDFLEKVFDKMPAVDLQDLPSLAYHLLLLASKGLHRRTVIAGILGFFAQGLRGPAPIVRQVEGTVLMHVNFAVKQDPSLGQEVMAVARADLGMLNHFTVAVLLSIARVRRFNESSIGVLKSAVVVSHRDYKLARDSKWPPDSLREEFLETAKCVERALLRAIIESNFGREHVIPSIVQFGFVLLESVDGENVKDVGATGEFMGVEELGIRILKTLFEVHDMARNEIIEQCKFRILSLKPQQSTPIIKLLGYLVQTYPYPMLEHVARLKELLDYFTFMHDNIAVALTIAMLPLIKFSRDLQDYIVLVVRKAMFRREDGVRIAATNVIVEIILMENRSKKNCLNSLQESSSQASCSQQADIPCGIGAGLFQELSGLLRRCLSQQDGVREIVYKGLLKLVVLDPSVTGSVFDFLWPHFLQFYSEVVEYIYGFFLGSDPLYDFWKNFGEYVLAYYEHLKNINDAEPHFRIDACFKLENGKVCLLEPLDYLLSCISWIILLQSHSKSDHPSEDSWPCFGFSLSQDNEIGRASSGESFSNALSKIRRSLAKCNLEDGLGQSQDSSSRSLHGEKTVCHGWVLLGIIEVFVNIIASEMEKAAEEQKIVLEKEIMELIDSYDSLEKESNTRAGGRKSLSRAAAQDNPDKVVSDSKEGSRLSLAKLSRARKPYFATSCIHLLLVTAVKSYVTHNCNDKRFSQNQSQSSSFKTIERYLKLTSFALKACLHQLKSITVMESVASDDPLKTLISGDIIKLGQPIMQLVWLLKPVQKSDEDPKKKESKEKKNLENKGDQLLLSLLCLNELFKIYSSGAHLTELVDQLLSVAAPNVDLRNSVDAVQGINDKQGYMLDDQNLKSMHMFLDERIKPLYAELIALSLFKESEVLSELILIIGKKLPREPGNSHGIWAVNICKSNSIENPNATRSTVALAIHLIPAPNDLIVAHDMASELLKVVGSEDQDPIERSNIFPVINHLTKNAVANLLVHLVESSIIDLDWAVSKIKAISILGYESIGIQKNHQFGERSSGLVLEEALYSRSEALVHVLSSFAGMNLKDSQAEQLLRVNAKFYKLLARMTKLRIAPKGCKQILPSTKFQKLAEVTCKKLTSPLYNFVALVQRNQQENAQSRGIVNKIKRENKCIPDLIFQIEDYEKYLIQLSKLTKLNLLRHAKRSTARDFKILETKKATTHEETTEQEPSQGNCTSSEDESSGESKGHDEENISNKDASPEASGGDGDMASELAAEDSEADEDDQEMVIRTKRFKISKVVQDSDEET